MKYYLHKADGTVKIKALLEERADNYSDCITFGEILNEYWGGYTPVTLIAPDNIGAEVYTTVYGDQMLKTTIDEPRNRLPIYRAGGKRYAYIDYRQIDEFGDYVGLPIRARFEIVEEG